MEERFWDKAGKQIREIGTAVSRVAKDIQNDALVGTKIGSLKIEQIGFENQRAKALEELGHMVMQKNAYKKLRNKKVDAIAKKIQTLENKIKRAKAKVSNLKKNLTISKQKKPVK